ncbi:MAG: hypothetical protein HYU66_27710, partial [Armatimonadetes bacterium]|nr:hypothetical protein [Armatimonadota bacterium]
MRPVRELWRAVLVVLAVVVAVAPLRRGLFGLPGTARLLMPLPARSLADAERVGTAWAWEAVAEGLEPGSADRPRAFERALALVPTDEVTLVRRAACALQKDGPMAAQAVPAARALVAAYPDNAYGHYLLAAALLRAGDRDGAVRELRLGNQAPRYAPGHRESMERRMQLEAQLAGRSGQLGLPTWNGLGELAPLRELARQLAASGDAQTALELARFGGRVRDEADQVIVALVGIAIQSVAFRGPGPAERPHEGVAGTEEERRREAERRLAKLAQGFKARLGAAGLGSNAGWVDGETANSAAVRRAAMDVARSMWPIVGPFGASMAWGLWAMLMTATAGLLLLSLLPGRLRRVDALPWQGADLVLLWAVTLVPGLAVTALLLRIPFAHMAGGDAGS